MEMNPFERAQELYRSEEELRDSYYMKKSQAKSHTSLHKPNNNRTTSKPKLTKNASFSKGLDKKINPTFPNM